MKKSRCRCRSINLKIKKLPPPTLSFIYCPGPLSLFTTTGLVFDNDSHVHITVDKRMRCVHQIRSDLRCCDHQITSIKTYSLGGCQNTCRSKDQKGTVSANCIFILDRPLPQGFATRSMDKRKRCQHASHLHTQQGYEKKKVNRPKQSTRHHAPAEI